MAGKKLVTEMLTAMDTYGRTPTDYLLLWTGTGGGGGTSVRDLVVSLKDFSQDPVAGFASLDANPLLKMVASMLQRTHKAVYRPDPERDLRLTVRIPKDRYNRETLLNAFRARVDRDGLMIFCADDEKADPCEMVFVDRDKKNTRLHQEIRDLYGDKVVIGTTESWKKGEKTIDSPSLLLTEARQGFPNDNSPVRPHPPPPLGTTPATDPTPALTTPGVDPLENWPRDSKTYFKDSRTEEWFTETLQSLANWVPGPATRPDDQALPVGAPVRLLKRCRGIFICDTDVNVTNNANSRISNRVDILPSIPKNMGGHEPMWSTRNRYCDWVNSVIFHEPDLLTAIHRIYMQQKTHIQTHTLVLLRDLFGSNCTLTPSLIRVLVGNAVHNDKTQAGAVPENYPVATKDKKDFFYKVLTGTIPHEDFTLFGRAPSIFFGNIKYSIANILYKKTPVDWQASEEWMVNAPRHLVIRVLLDNNHQATAAVLYFETLYEGGQQPLQPERPLTEVVKNRLHTVCVGYLTGIPVMLTANPHDMIDASRVRALEIARHLRLMIMGGMPAADCRKILLALQGEMKLMWDLCDCYGYRNTGPIHGFVQTLDMYTHAYLWQESLKASLQPPPPISQPSRFASARSWLTGWWWWASPPAEIDEQHQLTRLFQANLSALLPYKNSLILEGTHKDKRALSRAIDNTLRYLTKTEQEKMKMPMAGGAGAHDDNDNDAATGDGDDDDDNGRHMVSYQVPSDYFGPVDGWDCEPSRLLNTSDPKRVLGILEKLGRFGDTLRIAGVLCRQAIRSRDLAMTAEFLNTYKPEGLEPFILEVLEDQETLVKAGEDNTVRKNRRSTARLIARSLSRHSTVLEALAVRYPEAHGAITSVLSSISFQDLYSTDSKDCILRPGSRVYTEAMKILVASGKPLFALLVRESIAPLFGAQAADSIKTIEDAAFLPIIRAVITDPTAPPSEPTRRISDALNEFVTSHFVAAGDISEWVRLQPAIEEVLSAILRDLQCILVTRIRAHVNINILQTIFELYSKIFP